MKTYTDLEQSKKLAKILTLESADMRYGYIAPYDYSDRMYDGGYDEIPYPKDFLKKNPNFSANEYDAELPCWSLAALLQVLPIEAYTEIDNACCTLDISRDTLGKWFISYHNRSYGSSLVTCTSKELLDACYEMIIKLHELKMLRL